MRPLKIMFLVNIIKNNLFLITLVMFGVIYIRYIEKQSIYIPFKEIESYPNIIGLTYEDISLKTSDKFLLNSWYIPCEGAKDTVLVCHGNGGNISHRLEKIAIFNKLGLNVFIFDYRGYGKSKGSPSEKGLYRDAEAACAYLLQERRIPAGNIILYGESLGGAVAIEIASKHRFKALIVEESFTSVKDMTKRIYPFLPYILLESRFDSISKIKKIDLPKLIIHSVDDEIVPFGMGQRLFEAAAPPKEFLRIRGSHNTAFMDSEEKFADGINSFLKKLPKDI